jgi:hypothetical protein
MVAIYYHIIFYLDLDILKHAKMGIEGCNLMP